MPINLRIIIFVSAIVFSVIVLRTLKEKKISTKLSLLWLFACVLLMFAATFSRSIIWLSGILGFEEAVNMVFFFGVLVLLVISFCLCIVISKQQKTITILIQEVSLLKKRNENEWQEE